MTDTTKAERFKDCTEIQTEVIQFAYFDLEKTEVKPDREYAPIKFLITNEIVELICFDDAGRDRFCRLIRECSHFANWLHRQLQDCETRK